MPQKMLNFRNRQKQKISNGSIKDAMDGGSMMKELLKNWNITTKKGTKVVNF